MPFDEDGRKRNIFQITIENANHKFVFDFGTSLKDSIENPNSLEVGKEIEFYSGLKFEGLNPQYLSYSAKVKVSDLKEAKTFNDCKKLIDRKKAEQIYLDFKKANTDKYRPHLGILNFNEWFDMLVSALIRKTSELEKKNWGVAIQSKEIKHPSNYDVLACLTKYDPGTFENFCSEFGYDTDSRKAFKTYKAVRREWKNIERLFTPEQIEQLAEIN